MSLLRLVTHEWYDVSTSSLLHTGSQRCLITMFMEHHITSRNVKVSITTCLLCCCCPISRERKVGKKSCGIEVVWQWPLWPSTPAVMWQWKNNTRHSTKVAAFTFDRKVFFDKRKTNKWQQLFTVFAVLKAFLYGLIWCGPLPVLKLLIL